MSVLYDAEGNVASIGEEQKDSLQDLPLFNFDPPTPKPDWFDAKVNEMFGYVDGDRQIPAYRVVWGMDKENLHFAMGKMRMKYPTVVDSIQHTIGYKIVNTASGDHKNISYAKAKARYWDEATQAMTRNVKPYELIVPIVKEEEVEIGSPWWVVEQFAKPEYFGTPEEWEQQRRMFNPEDARQYIDCLGPYPKKGAYIHWFDLLMYTEEGCEYKELDESCLEWIRANHVSNVARKKRLENYDPAKAREAKLAKADDYWERERDAINREMMDVKKNRVYGFMTPENKTVVEKIASRFGFMK